LGKVILSLLHKLAFFTPAENFSIRACEPAARSLHKGPFVRHNARAVLPGAGLELATNPESF